MGTSTNINISIMTDMLAIITIAIAVLSLLQLYYGQIREESYHEFATGL